MKKAAFSLIEVLIVVAIIGILAVALTLSFRSSRQKGEDAQVKADLNRLKIAFEDYYNDHSCYPPAAWFDSQDDCGSNQLAPYLSAIPCEGATGLPYPVEKDPTGCSWFKIYAHLSNPNDPQAVALQGPTGSNLGNFGVSSSNTTVVVSGPGADPVYYYCSAVHNCSAYDHTRYTCTPTYYDPNCDGVGGCGTVGTCTPR